MIAIARTLSKRTQDIVFNRSPQFPSVLREVSNAFLREYRNFVFTINSKIITDRC
jgi:hypothetical protein